MGAEVPCERCGEPTLHTVCVDCERISGRCLRCDALETALSTCKEVQIEWCKRASALERERDDARTVLGTVNKVASKLQAQRNELVAALKKIGCMWADMDAHCPAPRSNKTIPRWCTRCAALKRADVQHRGHYKRECKTCRDAAGKKP